LRLNRESILNFINQTINRRAQSRRDLIAVYSCGSFLGDNYLLNGSGDVDLIFVLGEKPEKERELTRISDDLFLDISFRTENEYRDTRALRVDPWLGPEISTCKILHDPQHFLDYVQASVRGQFERPDHVFQRAKSFADLGRSEWYRLVDGKAREENAFLAAGYLHAIWMTLNAIASLDGPPIAERRLMLEFPSRAEAAGEPGLFQALLGMLGADKISAELMIDWKTAWAEAFSAVQTEESPERFHPVRLKYFQGAFGSDLNPEQLNEGLWTFLKTWAEIACSLPEDSDQWKVWSTAFNILELNKPSLDSRLQALDALLDNVEEILDDWGRKNGI